MTNRPATIKDGNRKIELTEYNEEDYGIWIFQAPKDEFVEIDIKKVSNSQTNGK